MKTFKINCQRLKQPDPPDPQPDPDPPPVKFNLR